MAEVVRRICDIDGKDDGVLPVSVTVGRRTRVMDVCKRCYRSVTVSQVMETGGTRSSHEGHKRFKKTEILE